MKKRTITVNGQEYPFELTMGAMLQYKRETGHEATQIDFQDMESVLVYLWCCVCSACRRDGVAFSLTSEAFADNLTQAELVACLNALRPDGAQGETTTDQAPVSAKKKHRA